MLNRAQPTATGRWLPASAGSAYHIGRQVPEISRAQQDLFESGHSPRQKFAAHVVGRDGWGPLLKYEFVQQASQNVAGAVGLALRKMMYPWLLGACGRNVVFGQNVVLRHPHKIRIGDNVAIDDNCLIDAKGESNAGITIGSGVFIGRNSILSCKNGDITIGDAANIGFNCEVFSASQVVIGASTLLAAYCYVIGGDHDASDPAFSVLDQARRSAGVTIGSGAWLGAGAKILDGVVLGDGAIVGAGAVVREAVPAGAIAVGVPARVVGQRGAAR
jgi:acetyltransferase-like isoleucine patch superfamily enzyme